MLFVAENIIKIVRAFNGHVSQLKEKKAYCMVLHDVIIAGI
jgi:hypothetical protein